MGFLYLCILKTKAMDILRKLVYEDKSSLSEFNVESLPSAQGDVSLRLSPEQLYIVKVGSRAFKVAL